MNYRTFVTFLAVLIFGPALRAEPLVVHEWGTFTMLQDEQGRTIKGINTDDEPLPKFVHSVHGDIMQSPSEVPPVMFKGVSRVHPDVLVRLETPVIYFYPPKGTTQLKVDVDVAFNGGWLTQFYPNAKAVAPGVSADRMNFGALKPTTVGTLNWNSLTVGGDKPGPDTTSKVWLAPRDVKAASATTTTGETERYLFYRGVGKLDAPVTVTRDARDASVLQIRSGLALKTLMLVDVRDDGAIALRGLESLAANVAAPLPSTFSAKDYDAGNLKSVRTQLIAALKADGLFQDEAEAMMNTWESSYFKRPGLRLFFMVPDAWTNAVLPLKFRTNEAGQQVLVERAMIGRIEIVTPGQRERLIRIGQTAPSPSGWLSNLMNTVAASKDDQYRQEFFDKVMSGERSLLSMNITMPSEFRDYLQLGRFRNALILDEQAHRPTANLKKFIDQYDLQYATVEKDAPTISAKQ